MMNLFTRSLAMIALLAMLSACNGFGGKRSDSTATPPDPSLDGVADWLSGEFSNGLQVYQQGGGTAVRYQFSAVPCGTRVAQRCLFSQRYQAPADDQPVAPRLYLLRAVEQGVRVIIEPLPAALVDLPGQDNPAQVLSTVQPGVLDQECAITLLYRDGVWRGQTDPQRCQVPVGGQMRGLARQVSLTAAGFDLAETLFDERGNRVAGHAPGEQVQARRMRYFAGRAGIDGNRSGAWEVSAQFRLSDDGREVDLLTPEGGAMGYRLRLLTLPASAERAAMLRLSLIDADSGRSVANVWSEPQAQLLGLHNGWFQISLRYEKQ